MSLLQEMTGYCGRVSIYRGCLTTDDTCVVRQPRYILTPQSPGKTAGKVQESLALAFNLVVAMPRPGGLFAILL